MARAGGKGGSMSSDDPEAPAEEPTPDWLDGVTSEQIEQMTWAELAERQIRFYEERERRRKRALLGRHSSAATGAALRDEALPAGPRPQPKRRGPQPRSLEQRREDLVAWGRSAVDEGKTTVDRL